MLRKLPVLKILLLLFSLGAKSQPTIDSLQALLHYAKDDTAKVSVLQNLEKAYFNADNDSALYYNKACEKLILQLNATSKMHVCYHEFVRLYHAKYAYDTALLYCLKAIKAAKHDNNQFEAATSYRAVFNIYHNLRENDSAVKYGLYSLQLTQSIGDTNNIATNYGNLCWLYKDLAKMSKAIDFGEKGIAAGKLYKDTIGMLISMNNLANCYFTMNQNKKAITLFRQLLTAGKQANRRRSVRNALINLGALYYAVNDAKELNNTVTAFNSYVKDDKTMSASDIAFGKLINGQNFILQNNYAAAEKEFIAGLKRAEEDSLINAMLDLYNNMSKLQFAMHNYTKGNYYDEKWSNLDQQIKEDGLAEYEAGLDKKYETVKKENEIRLKNSEIQQKTNLNYVFAGAGLLLIIASVLGYRAFKQKQKMQRQRITELETEKQLAATEAVLKGEEQERSRLAKDLHDGLGGMLSGIKYSLNTMKGNIVLTPENAQAFERSMDMLDSSIKEMRRVAHNMMPEALVRFGLDTALKDFCVDINRSGALKINYISLGMSNAAIEQTLAITIFRIVQELINNIIKHAKALSAVVQITKTGNDVSVTVEDDGKGFDTNILKLSKGIGWSNIENRIEFLKGKADIASAPGKGTSVLIEFHI